MKRDMVTISDNGTVNVPTNVQMRDFEIAELLGVMLPTVRGAIKRLLKTRFVTDCNGGIVQDSQIIPEYFGLDVVISVAFQVQSYEAELLRVWILKQITTRRKQQIFIQLTQNSIGVN